MIVTAVSSYRLESIPLTYALAILESVLVLFIVLELVQQSTSVRSIAELGWSAKIPVGLMQWTFPCSQHCEIVASQEDLLDSSIRPCRD